jgi:CubicO group peptidase (beta-lactamase class C family)
MRSGLDAAETGNGFDPVSQMEFTQDDMAGFAARHRLKRPPGGAWEYTSANTLILDRLIGRTVGGGAAGLSDFAARELFSPLHMSGVTIEFDGTGVFVGSPYVYASARDYARFGQLYLNDGVAPDGARILPEGLGRVVSPLHAGSPVWRRLLDQRRAESRHGAAGEERLSQRWLLRQRRLWPAYLYRAV